MSDYQDLLLARELLDEATARLDRLEDIDNPGPKLAQVQAALRLKLARIKELEPKTKGLPSDMDDVVAQRAAHMRGEWFPGEVWPAPASLLAERRAKRQGSE